MNIDQIHHRTDSGPWIAAHTAPFRDEAELRDLIAAHPTLIPGVQAPACAVIEVPMGGVSLQSRVDVVIVDAAGSIFIVECKLGSNGDLRRAAFAQLLAPAVVLAGLPVGQFDRMWTVRSPERRGFAEILAPHDEELREDLRFAVQETLSRQTFHLVLACDRLPADSGTHELMGYMSSHLSSSPLSLEVVELAKVLVGDAEVVVPFGSVRGAWGWGAAVQALVPARAPADEKVVAPPSPTILLDRQEPQQEVAAEYEELVFEVLDVPIPKQLLLSARDDDASMTALWDVMVPDPRARVAVGGLFAELLDLLDSAGDERTNWCINVLTSEQLRLNAGPVEVAFLEPRVGMIAIATTEPIEHSGVYNDSSPFKSLLRLSDSACRVLVPFELIAEVRPQLLAEAAKVIELLAGRKLSGTYATAHAATLVRLLRDRY